MWYLQWEIQTPVRVVLEQAWSKRQTMAMRNSFLFLASAEIHLRRILQQLNWNGNLPWILKTNTHNPRQNHLHSLQNTGKANRIFFRTIVPVQKTKPHGSMSYRHVCIIYTLKQTSHYYLGSVHSMAMQNVRPHIKKS